ncbi:hypothetical protein OAK75_04080 [Bacteriovoracales bacterium]|nr:hypothetical protein [Bacteriovoracales bacterium]
MPQSKEMKNILDSWKKLKKNLYKSVRENKLQEAQKQVSRFITDSQTNINKKVDKDVDSIKKKFVKEKNHIEKILDTALKKEVKKVTDFINEQKKELDNLQKSIQKFAKKTKKKKKKVTKKKVAKKKTTKKKVTKKKVSKKSTAKKATKK